MMLVGVPVGPPLGPGVPLYDCPNAYRHGPVVLCAVQAP